ncbi:MAG: alpha/beta hydrolase [Alphaproteobacteria bacterium]|nr:alpha/beta hydrolase [Alphaproteobacteria bacterium]MBU1515800.1 alpha/beta hydrolase [Alphaproteobacteria bacterium]MBU2094022.1 alpha/beta hydrolase [Alphaproteobacteria bacterium]MBU2152621.1 alpha/beta hydrolase [Alphaproteobacteria bacterium]MBU2308832.1 alpha/beta hydrolase [Alphaproteobacteria bacterium]
MATLTRDDGVNLYYEVHGPTGSRAGPTILLSHGYSATSNMWRGQVEALSLDHRLVVWDMRGHGQSDSPDDPALYSEAATVADMAALLDAVGAKTAIVGGLSLGGYMSLAFNRVHPERVEALLIIDTGPGYKNDEAREGWNRTSLKTAERYETDGLKLLEGGSAERRTAQHRSAKGLALAARGMLTQRDAGVITSLPGIKVPSIVVVGSEDAPFIPASEYMTAKIPGAKRVVIEGAGHAANIDQPARFNAALMDFLGGLKTPA